MCIITINKPCFQENSLTNVTIVSASWVPNRQAVIYVKSQKRIIVQSNTVIEGSLILCRGKLIDL